MLTLLMLSFLGGHLACFPTARSVRDGEGALQAAVFRTAMKGELRTLDPALVQSVVEERILSHAFEPLIFIDPKDGRVVPLAAESFEFSADQRVLRFRLKPELRWSDGSKLTAFDFEHSLRRLLRPSLRAPHRAKLLGIKGVSGVLEGAMLGPKDLGIEAVSERDLVITFSDPSLRMLAIFAQAWAAPVKRQLASEEIAGSASFTNWVSNGPYVPVRKSEKAILLRKNPHHRWAKQIKVNEIVIYLVQSSQEALKLFESGEIHQVGHRDFPLSAEAVALYQGRSRLLFQPDLHTHFLRINPERIPLSQGEVRRAVAMGLDRELMVSSMGEAGQWAPAFSLMPSGVMGYTPPKGYFYSTSRARQELQLHGYCVKAAEEGCKSLGHMTLIFPDVSFKRKMALAIEAMLTRVLPISSFELIGLPMAQFNHRIAKGDYQLALDEMAALPESPFSLLEAFLPTKATAGAFYNMDFRQQIMDAQMAWTTQDALKFYRQAEGILLDGAEMIPLLHVNIPMLVSPKISGFVPNVLDQHRYTSISFR